VIVDRVSGPSSFDGRWTRWSGGDERRAEP